MDIAWSLPLVLALLGLGYIFSAASWTTLAARFDQAKRRHMLIVEARQMRLDYDTRLNARRDELLAEIGFEEDEDGTIVVGSESEADAQRALKFTAGAG